MPSQYVPGDKQIPDMADKIRQTYLQHEEEHPLPIVESPEAAPSDSVAEIAPPVAELSPDTDVAQLRKEYEELHDRYIRLAADFENYRKRMLRERETWAETLTEQLLLQLLPIIDQLQMALETPSSSTEVLRQGTELIYRNILKLLEQLGVQPIETSPGEPFDIYQHEAVLRLPSEIPEGHIIKEFQRGYRFRDRILRYPRVVVSAGPQTDHSVPHADHPPASSPEASS
ncbi:MAG: nucleotide exchange factor GrpE [Candidatus Kapabacteria bacterium]|nr:nucleotide exchange factor GrpE [Candidatus Kapabacteria bacterium]